MAGQFSFGGACRSALRPRSAACQRRTALSSPSPPPPPPPPPPPYPSASAGPVIYPRKHKLRAWICRRRCPAMAQFLGASSPPRGPRDGPHSPFFPHPPPTLKSKPYGGDRRLYPLKHTKLYSYSKLSSNFLLRCGVIFSH